MNLQPSQAKFLLQFLLPQLQAEHAITTKILSAIPKNQGDYRPHPNSRSAFELARHIAFTEIWFLDAVIHQQFAEDFATSDAPLQSGQDIAQWYDFNFAIRISQLEALSAAHLATPVPYIELRNDPAVAYLNIAIRHSVHHRGQLTAYLRPMGEVVPAIYVESADEPFPPADGSIAPQPPPAF